MDEERKLVKIRKDLERIGEEKNALRNRIAALTEKEAEAKKEIDHLEGRVLMKELKVIGITYEEMLKELKRKQVKGPSVTETDESKENPDEEGKA